MNDDGDPQRPGGEPIYSQTFRFAGVELKPGEDAQALGRKVTRSRIVFELLINGVASVIVGLVPLLGERFLASTGLYDLPSPYPYLTHGLPLFYIGWAMYWGIRDWLLTTSLDEHHPLGRFMNAVLSAHGWLGGALIRVIVAYGSLTAYILLGGGVYGFCKLVRQFRRIE